MKSTMTPQVDTDTLLWLIGQLRVRGGSQDLSAAITSAIELWLREQSKLAAGNDPASVRGYQWKSLFMPEGTVLRSWSYGEHNYARALKTSLSTKPMTTAARPATSHQFFSR